MKRARPFWIPERTPVFVGCEGQSEVGYAGVLQNMVRESGLPFHLHIHDLGQGAGDPCARMQLTLQRLSVLKRTRVEPKHRFVFLDNDRNALIPERVKLAETLAQQNNITIIWQEPCFEAVLLRHLPALQGNRPPDTQAALQALTRAWPNYQKPMSSASLMQRIDRAAISRIATVEPDLQALFTLVGLYP